MKVICINAENTGEIEYDIMIIEGEIYDAYQSPTFINSYRILGYEIHPKDGIKVNYKKSRFIPLSEIDEMEMERKDFYAGCKSGLSFLK